MSNTWEEIPTKTSDRAKKFLELSVAKISYKKRLDRPGDPNSSFDMLSNRDRRMSELLNTAVARLQCMKGDVELLVHAFAGAVVLAAAEDAGATAAITYDDKESLNAQRKTEDKRSRCSSPGARRGTSPTISRIAWTLSGGCKIEWLNVDQKVIDHPGYPGEPECKLTADARIFDRKSNVSLFAPRPWIQCFHLRPPTKSYGECLRR
ncbi:hypothetical protein [Rhizobium leguminosarum]|uniref:hypothetical protein n=1 Tax=Rhizobium leguminosarum TaxID=384 RepID=UPI003F98BBA1